MFLPSVPLGVGADAFDALALLTAGVPRVVAIFGVQGWRWAWARTVREIVFALDADGAGQQAGRTLARQAALRGKRVAVLPSAGYGGTKDVSAAGVLALEGWLAVSAVLDLPEALQEQWQERVAIMAVDGGVSEAEVQRLPRLDASSGLYDTPRQYHASGYAMIGGWNQPWQRSSLAPHTTQEA